MSAESALVSRIRTDKFYPDDIIEHYDNQGNIKQIIFPDGFQEDFVYDDNGNLIHFENSYGIEVFITYDDNHMEIYRLVYSASSERLQVYKFEKGVMMNYLDVEDPTKQHLAYILNKIRNK